MTERTFRIAVDIGGTFTDCVVLDDRGRRLTTKALTMPADPAEGVETCVRLAADALQIELGALLRGTVAFVHGTTESVLTRSSSVAELAPGCS